MGATSVSELVRNSETQQRASLLVAARSPRSELELVTEEELSALLKVYKRQLYKMRMRGEIPYFKLGRAVRFRVGEVVEALEGTRIGPGNV